MHEAYHRAIELLRRNRTRYGFTISSSSQHVRARDGVMAGLASLLTGESILIGTSGDTLDTLAQFQGPHGEIPLYVDLDTGQPNFGDLAGSVESVLWFCIGCARYSLVTGDRRWLQAKSTTIQKALYVAGTWQYNDRGLIYVPWGGIYPQSGYLLTEQILYALAIQLLTAALDTTQPSLDQTSLDDDKTLVEINYWPTADNIGHPRIYHVDAFQTQVQQGERPYFLSNLSPRGYNAEGFDGQGNALALVAKMGRKDQVDRLFKVASGLASRMCFAIPPAYYPAPPSADCGIWPIIGAWWAVAAATRLHTTVAQPFVDAVHAANMLDEGCFPELLHTQTRQCSGERGSSLSAAGSIFAEMALQGNFPLR